MESVIILHQAFLITSNSQFCLIKPWKDGWIWEFDPENEGLEDGAFSSPHFCACLCVKMIQEMKDLHLRRTEP